MFECKCVMTDLSVFALGHGNTKKEAKSESAKQQILMICHIPDVESAIMSILMSTRLSDAVSGSSRSTSTIFEQNKQVLSPG